MQKKKATARYHERSNSERNIRASATAGAVAGARDAAELDDNDPVAAWLEHVEDGGADTPEGQDAFKSAYEAAYARLFNGSDLEVNQVATSENRSAV